MEKKKRTRTVYPKEFKEQAVARCKEIGRNKTCSELGISYSALDRWRSELEPGNSNISSTSKPSYEELLKENQRLKKEIGYIEEINKVLKKSTAIFSSEQIRGLK